MKDKIPKLSLGTVLWMIGAIHLYAIRGKVLPLSSINRRSMLPRKERNQKIEFLIKSRVTTLAIFVGKVR